MRVLWTGILPPGFGGALLHPQGSHAVCHSVHASQIMSQGHDREQI